MAREVAIIGGGPAGLRAAEVIASAGEGYGVHLFEQKASVGRKFLVAGGGGLNLTHSESLDAFAARYGDSARWQSLLKTFSPDDLRAWAAELGVETFVGTSGRVFPMEKKAAPLLRRWVARLRKLGVEFHVHHAWRGWSRTPAERFQLHFLEKPDVEVDAVLLALGGASWPETGSDGAWVPILRKAGIVVTPWQPANCGYQVAWPANLLEKAEGLPLKNIAASIGGKRVEGECVITRYGLEGGILYQLGPVLRATPEPTIMIDFKPTLSVEALLKKWATPPAPTSSAFLRSAVETWRLSTTAAALLEVHSYDSARALAEKVKNYPIVLGSPRPLAEAISSAGGIAWSELEESLMLRAVPGLFAAGEMIDWEAPTGGYLLQGCFATGTRAAQGICNYLEST